MFVRPIGKKSRQDGSATRAIVFAIDTLLALGVWAFAAFILHGFDWEDTYAFLAKPYTFVLICIQTAGFLLFGTYNIIIRYIGEQDYRKAMLSVLGGTVVFLVLYGIVYPELGAMRVLATLLIDTVFLIAAMVAVRIAMRMLYDRYMRPGEQQLGQRTAIFGAGELGNMLERVLHHNKSHGYRVSAFFDDNPKVHRKELNGITIYNPSRGFEDIIRKHQIEVMIIGVRDLPPERRAEIINACLALDVMVLKVPPTESWLHGSLRINQLKQANLDDLLGRAPIRIDEEAVRTSIAGQVIMVTGCAGSIGSEIVRQLLLYAPARVVGIDMAETPLHDLTLQLEPYVAAGRFLPLLADVRDADAMRRIFGMHRPRYVFHSAAYKHVPVLEQFPEEAIRSNVLGTKVLAEMATEFGVEKFVMMSTDKAVNPANVMGASKRIAEMYVQALNFQDGHRTQFITTRFGNVLGSNGSVIPIFSEQIARREPITVTHPEITRYFMSIREACRLVLEAGAMGRGGEIFVFDMGEPVRILDLAHRMIKLAGLIPERDIEIRFTGLRPGEKLYEELLDDREHLAETHHPKIFRAVVRPCGMDEIRQAVDLLIAAAHAGQSAEDLVRSMKSLVPEFTSQNSIYNELDASRP